MEISYERYLDQVYGGWIGKSMGGAVGARFEGHKGWIEIAPDDMFPAQVPPNDDLDLQVLWLKVLEEKGLVLNADDLAEAWLAHCWYPFNEYGIFRRNWRLGIHPPMSGRFGNQFWETGMGCPIRAEIWGYVFPGAPDLAAHYAGLDGSLDHTEQSIGAEKMFAAMASLAFFVPNVRQLIDRFIHYLPPDTPIDRLARTAVRDYDAGLSLRDAHAHLMLLEGLPEACDAQINVPFTLLGLLYGQDDLQETMLSALRCGYDTDCTLAIGAALIGQILGASRIPAHMREAIGDDLLMGIEYQRDEMSLSALARDTARMGILLAEAGKTGTHITDAPPVAPLPDTAIAPPTALSLTYHGLPAAAPGDVVTVKITAHGRISPGTELTITGPQGWRIAPAKVEITGARNSVTVQLRAPQDATRWGMRHPFEARVRADHLAAAPPVGLTFGVAGAGLWQFLGAYYDPLPDAGNLVQQQRDFNHHFVSLSRPYLPGEPHLDTAQLYAEWSRCLGRPALIASYEHEIELARLIGLRGPYCAYLARTVISPQTRQVYIMIGNTDSYRLYLNGELVAEVDEHIYWTPFNNAHPATLQAGENHLLLKLLKRGDCLKFTLGFRERQQTPGGTGINKQDWVVDLADIVPSL